MSVLSSRGPSRRFHALRRAGVGLLVAAHVLAVSPVVHADAKTAQAEDLFQRGRKLMQEQKYAEACPLFASSQKLDPSLGTLLNLADCHEKVGKTASAWGEWREAAQLAAKEGDTKREQIATDRAAALESKLMRLAVKVTDTTSGLVVSRDGEAIDPATYGLALPTDPGVHRIEASAPGKKPWSVEVKLDKEATTETIEVPALEDAPPEPPPAVKEPPPAVVAPPPAPPKDAADPGSGMRTAGLVIGGVGVAALVTGGVFGLVASSKWSSGKDDCPGNVCRTQAAFDDTQDARRFANLSTIAFVVGGVCTAAGLGLYLAAPSRARGPVTTDTASIRLSPAVAPSVLGFSLGGSF